MAFFLALFSLVLTIHKTFLVPILPPDVPMGIQYAVDLMFMLPPLVMMIVFMWLVCRAVSAYGRNERKLGILMMHWQKYESLPPGLTFTEMLNPHFTSTELSAVLAKHK
jgi:hypothetical protein